MIPAPRNRRDAAETGNAHWCPAVAGSAVTELSTVVASPALDFASSAQGTGLIVSACNRRHPAQTGNTDRHTTVGGAAVAELTVGIVAPAFDFATGVQSAAM